MQINRVVSQRWIDHYGCMPQECFRNCFNLALRKTPVLSYIEGFVTCPDLGYFVIDHAWLLNPETDTVYEVTPNILDCNYALDNYHPVHAYTAAALRQLTWGTGRIARFPVTLHHYRTEWKDAERLAWDKAFAAKGTVPLVK